MFSAILTYIGNGITDVFTLFGSVFSGGIALFWDGTALTDLGEIMLLGAIVGLVLMGIKFIRSMIPFVG